MLFFVVLTFLSATMTGLARAEDEGCALPDELRGQYLSSVSDWRNLSITNTTISKIPVLLDGMPLILDFSCFHHNNGTQYLLRSEERSFAEYHFHVYICLDIVPSTTAPYLTFFRFLTDLEGKDHKVVSTSETANVEDICNRAATEIPMDFSYLVKKDFEQTMGEETCPRVLHAEFSVNLTGQDQQKCPQGFELDGCKLKHMVFNYSSCGGGAEGYGSGSVTYTCLSSVEKGGVTYTILLEKDESQPNNPFVYTCLTEESKNGQVNITKNPGKCRATSNENTVTMEAKETVSCRKETPPASEAPTTPAGSENPTGTPTNTSASSPTGGTGTGTGDGGEGGGCSMYSAGFFTLLLPAMVSVLLAVNV